VSFKIRLSYEQIEGKCKHKILLSELQKKKIYKIIRFKKIVELGLDYEQIRINLLGGFLPLLCAGICTLGALKGAGAAVAYSVINAKHQSSEEEM
jgi:hypothetical protein